jgi:mannosyltransferase OCH1-like enzyme
MIPKTIYQTWYTKKLPEKIKNSVDSMLKVNPNYSYELYDDIDCLNFLKNNYGSQVIKAYESLNVGAAKADLWRYAILYKNGGIYLDIDSEIYSNLDSLIQEDDIAIVSREKNPDHFVQWCLMFDKNHPILENVLKKCVYNILNKTTENILQLTGPSVFSQSIIEVLSPLELDVYNTSDSIIREKMENKIFSNIKTKIYSFDYENYCNFKHSNYEDLYKNKEHWKSEIINTSTFK